MGAGVGATAGSGRPGCAAAAVAAAATAAAASGAAPTEMMEKIKAKCSGCENI